MRFFSYLHIKSILDHVVSFILILCLSPLLCLLLILCSADTRSLGLFFQKRVGINKKMYYIIKFKTMLPVRISANDNGIAALSASRVTSLGAILRTYKLDELPQLFNILLGDMSFVGPRPDVPSYTSRLGPEHDGIFSIRPGLISPASLKYRNEESLLAQELDPIHYYDKYIWPDKIFLNDLYLHKASFIYDLSLIIKAFFLLVLA